MTTRLRGFSFIEVTVGIVLLGLIVALSSQAIFNYQKSRNQLVDRQVLLWAASAQLERIAAGAALDSLPPGGFLPEGVSLYAESQPGDGDWRGFTRITVTATLTAGGGKELREQISGFIPAEGKP
jgi:prepilin-type N-terminal cleavage/methylation domain-containing protein